MEFWLAMLGSVIAAGGTFPYVLETIRGKAKPRIVTWLTWALLTGLASAAAFADGQVAAGVFALLGMLATATITVVGLRYGDRSYGRLDIVCMASVIVGLVLWQVFNSPAIGVWAAIIIDFVGLVPTYKHAWQAPHEETTMTYVLVFIGGMLTTGSVIAAGGSSVTALGYPLYTALSLGVIVGIIMYRKGQLMTAEAAEIIED
jgi:hypothetical protein